jgi:hypothetical protein
MIRLVFTRTIRIKYRFFIAKLCPLREALNMKKLSAGALYNLSKQKCKKW